MFKVGDKVAVKGLYSGRFKVLSIIEPSSKRFQTKYHLVSESNTAEYYYYEDELSLV